MKSFTVIIYSELLCAGSFHFFTVFMRLNSNCGFLVILNVPLTWKSFQKAQIPNRNWYFLFARTKSCIWRVFSQVPVKQVLTSECLEVSPILKKSKNPEKYLCVFLEYLSRLFATRFHLSKTTSWPKLFILAALFQVLIDFLNSYKHFKKTRAAFTGNLMFPNLLRILTEFSITNCNYKVRSHKIDFLSNKFDSVHPLIDP